MNDTSPAQESGVTPSVLVALAWLMVTLPLLWGVWQTIKKAAALFQ
jgi:hypothetical protein